jgi:isopenicillin-N epimerase
MGMLYVKKSKIEKIWPMMAAPPAMNGNIGKFEEIGTHSASQRNAISEALNFHDSIGVEREAERFRYLRKRWSNELREMKGVKILNSESSDLDDGDCYSRGVAGVADYAERVHDAGGD